MTNERRREGPEKKKGEVSVREAAEMEGAGGTGQESPPASGEVARASAPGYVDSASESLFRQVEQSGALPPSLKAPEAFGAALCTLSRRLSATGAQQLVRALPATISALVRPCAEDRDDEGEPFDRLQFLDTLARCLEVEATQAQSVAQSVFVALRGHLSREDVSRVESELPSDLRDLWNPRAAG